MDRYFYLVEEFNGHKEVHMSGNVFYNDGDETDTCFRYAQWVGIYFTVEELQSMLENGLFYETLYEKIKYLDDLTEEQAIEACRVYFGGEPGKWLHINHVNEDTPCGDYWFE